VTDRKIVLTLRDSLLNSAGQPLSSFDLVVLWTAFVKQHPAEGLALFRHVKGVLAFIRGEEGVIGGFVVQDPKTVALVLAEPDPRALARLCTPRLLPGSAKLGPYTVRAADAQRCELVPNKRGRSSQPFLDQCTIAFGNDRSPVVSYSLNKYDCVLMTARKDLEYVRKASMDRSQLIDFGRDRYFAGLNIDNPEQRAAVASLINAKDILANVKVEGEVVSSLLGDSLPSAAGAPPPQPGAAGAAQRTIRILYRSDDPVSVLAAGKLLSDLTHAGLTCELRGEKDTGYERLLTGRDYAVVIGWVDSRISTDESEKLRLSAAWFADQSDETVRIGEHLEVPLFAVHTFALCRSDIRFQDGRIAGVFRTGAVQSSR
jgi:hypothetical protein